MPERPDPNLPRATRWETVQAWAGLWKPRDTYVPPFPVKAAVITLVVVVAAVAALVTVLMRDKDENEARERRQTAAADARTRARLAREQTPHRAVIPDAGTRGAPRGELAERRLRLVAGLEAAITADTAARHRRGQLGLVVRRTDCVPYVRPRTPHPRPAPLSARSGRYECLAVTGDVPATGRTEAGRGGYPFWARVDFRRGSAVWCKITPRPAEGGIGSEIFVPLPRVCRLRDRG